MANPLCYLMFFFLNFFSLEAIKLNFFKNSSSNINSSHARTNDSFEASMISFYEHAEKNYDSPLKVSCASSEWSIEENYQFLDVLEKFITANKIRSIVDFECGYWSWQKFLFLRGREYTGVSLSKNAIDFNVKKFGKDQIQFSHINNMKTKLPSAELMIVNRHFSHMKEDELKQFFANFENYKFICACYEVDSETLSSTNVNLKHSRNNIWDLSKTPFGLRVISASYFSHGGKFYKVDFIQGGQGE